MATSLASLQRKTKIKRARVLIHGAHGIGKTTLACSAPAPVVIQVEDGLGTIDVDHFPLATTFGDVLQALGALYQEPNSFETVIVDSVDWLERLVWAEACATNGWKSIEDAGYGKGYIAAIDIWKQYIDGVNALRDDRNMRVIQIAHTEVKRFDSPENDPYDRYQIKLHKGAAALLQEHADIVGFLNYRVSTVKSDVGFNKKVTRATGSGIRVLHLEERPAFLAKNRYAMPNNITIPDDAANAWGAVAEHLPEGA